MNITPHDRVMIVAAHPDDETLAAGGLIQRVVKAGAAGRVLMVTSGDNNPWPQRWLEKRWRIGPAERERWGAMRRGEALAALGKLGFTGETVFLGFPDQGLTPALLASDAAVMASLCAALREWSPTAIVLPSPGDLHPDHNALHVLLQIALQQTGLAGISQLHYAVHYKQRETAHGARKQRAHNLVLDEAERARKRDAILCHKSQMILSRKRFLAYANREEAFFEPAPAQAKADHHPVAEARLDAHTLSLGVRLPMGLQSAIWIVGETRGESYRRRLALPLLPGAVPVYDTVTGAKTGEATARIENGLLRLRVDVPECASLLYVKYHRPAVFLDPAGWRQVPV